MRALHRQGWQTTNIANNINKGYEIKDKQTTAYNNNYTGVIVVISYSCSAYEINSDVVD